MNEKRTVELVVYSHGTRHVVGKATIEGSHITADISEEAAASIRISSIMLSGDMTRFSIDKTEETT